MVRNAIGRGFPAQAAVVAVSLSIAWVFSMPARAQLARWIDPAGGVYQDVTKWSPADVPDMADETALFMLPGAYVVTYDESLNYSLLELQVFDGDVTLRGIGANTNPMLTVDNVFIDGGDLTLERDGRTFVLTIDGLVVDGTSTLTILQSNDVYSTAATVGRLSGSDAAVIVNGGGSTWEVLELRIGQFGTGMVTIESGGDVTSNYSYIGDSELGVGEVTVSGNGSTWINDAVIYVGYEGAGTLTVEAGGAIESDVGVIGVNINTHASTVTVTGAGSSWTNTSILSVGSIGTSTLTIEAGGEVTNVNGFIASLPFTEATVTVRNTDLSGSIPATWSNDGSLYVAGDETEAGGSGTLNVETGGVVNVTDELIIWDDGTVKLTGGTINLGDLVFNGSTFQFDFGTLNFTTDQTIAVGGPIEQALGGERRIRVGQTLGVEGTATVNAPLELAGGALRADNLVVNSQFAFTAGLLELRGGQLIGLSELVVPPSGEFRAHGDYAIPITGAAGSTVRATGNLTLGDDAMVDGFYSNGRLDVGANTVTLLDANDVVFDSGAHVTLGGDTSPGTLEAAGGLTLDFGGNITGFGTVDTPNDAATPLVNNGHIAGSSLSGPAKPITLTGYVKGVGTLDNVVITGTDAPGFSTATVTRGSVAYDGTLQIEVEGSDSGAFDRIEHTLGAGVADLGGTLQVLADPAVDVAVGDLLMFIYAEGGIFNAFESVALPALDDGKAFRLLYGETIVALEIVLAGDYNGNGTVDAADYVVWRMSLNQTGDGLAADGDGDGEVTLLDYQFWITRFGNTAGSGSFSPQSDIPNPQSTTAPEPRALWLALGQLSLVIGYARARNRGTATKSSRSALPYDPS